MFGSKEFKKYFNSYTLKSKDADLFPNNVFFTNQKKVQSSRKKKKRKPALNKGNGSRKKRKTIVESKHQPKRSP